MPVFRCRGGTVLSLSLLLTSPVTPPLARSSQSCWLLAPLSTVLKWYGPFYDILHIKLAAMCVYLAYNYTREWIGHSTYG